MSSGFKIMWREHPLPTIVLAIMSAIVLATAVYEGVGNMISSHRDTVFFEKLQQLESKSEAHQMILTNFSKCMQDDKEVESNCITNTILLAEVNGYKNSIGEVFHDAGIPRK